MKMSKKLARKFAALATVSALTVAAVPMNVFAYGENVDVSTSTFKSDTDNSSAFQTWRDTVWYGTSKDNVANGAAVTGEAADSGKIALTPGATEKDLNFAWYSKAKGTPAVRVWKSGEDMSKAKVFTGTASDIDAENWQGSTYKAANKVNVTGYFENNTKYNYQYTDNYTNGSTVWSSAAEYSTRDAANFSVILTGDPQVGASGSGTDNTAYDESAARDTYNWNLTMEQALKTDSDAAFLLSAGDQIDKSGASKANDKKARESEYAGYLYPSVFRSLPIASTIGNHDMAGADYSNHFNNPNASALGATAAGGDYYFSYGDVLFISLNSNNRNQEEHRKLMEQAVKSNESAKWKVVIFHSDIYGSGQPHADTDATANRVIFAPLMDEFDIDICLTGHDHTYSRSYQILDGNVVNYDLSKGSVTDPEGTLYITTGSGSGSKYYNLLNYTPYYIAEKTNVCMPAFSTIDFTSGSLTIKTYDYKGNQYADDFTINKTTDSSSVDEVIAAAEEKLASIDKTKYTEESVKNLESKLDTLKKMRDAYTTAEDPMIKVITEGYGTGNDIISGYGSIPSADNKEDGKFNRLKPGMSTLLDKTIYTQIKSGVELSKEEQSVPVISATELLTAKGSVSAAIEGLKLAEEDTSVKEESSDKQDESTDKKDDTVKDETGKKDDDTVKDTPQTGDNTAVIIAASVAAMALAAGVSIIAGNRKKEEDCE